MGEQPLFHQFSDEDLRFLFREAERIVKDFRLTESPGELASIVIQQARRSGRPAASWQTRAIRLMRWRALDFLRRNREQPIPPELFSLLEPPALVDYDVLGSPTERLVVAGLRKAADSDETCARVIMTWLDLAGVLGQAPPTRLVASEVGLSHTGVRKALLRFRAILAKQAAEGIDAPRSSD